MPTAIDQSLPPAPRQDQIPTRRVLAASCDHAVASREDRQSCASPSPDRPQLDSQQRLEMEARRVEQLRQTAHRFVDDVSHELRSPLAVVKEYCSLVRDGLAGPTTVRQQEFLGVAISRIDDMSRLVDDMLDISKVESGSLGVRRERAPVARLLNAVWPTIERRAAQKKISLELAIDDELPELYCDIDKAGRALLNLAVNAIKFSPQQGQVTVSAQRAEGESIRISVSDNGPGIAPEELSQVFARFRQLGPGRRGAAGGYGLGLSIASELARLNLGSLEADSEPGKGSTFSLLLPCADAAAMILRQIERWNNSEAGSKRVTVLRASLPESADEDLQEAADEVVQSPDADSQFVFRAAKGVWIIAVRGSSRELQERRGEISRRWREWRQNCPVPAEAELALATLGAWRMDLQRAALVARFRSAVKRGAAFSACAKVLLVDDDAELTQALNLRMRAAGYDVLTAQDPAHAVRAARDARPDAIVLDLAPQGDNPLATLEQLKADDRTRHIPVVMLSASIADQQRALDRGARFFLTKPFDAANVVCAVESSLAGDMPAAGEAGEPSGGE